MLYLELFLTFFQIGLFGFGGGYAMLSMIQGEVVTSHGWLSPAEFTDIVAISQMTPGPIGINSATYVGYTAAINAGYSPIWGILGSVTATFAVVLPSFLIILAIALFFHQFKEYEAVENIFKGIRPAVVALIAAPTFSMAKSAKISKYNVWIPVVSALLIWLMGVSPVYIIAIAGLGGFVYGKLKN